MAYRHKTKTIIDALKATNGLVRILGA